jgi:peptidoglycan/LPS O-acetylase OafA/YrhL
VIEKAPSSQPRYFALDLLRAVAVVLVIGHHADLPEPPPYLAPVLRALNRGGWVGVDLFFVLSGFLVAGLLFREYAQHGAIDFPNFFIRRGLKIYPPFYLMLAATIVIVRLGGVIPISWSQILSEALFVQNYGTPFWGHTWSLAVEEHFYLLLPLLLIALQRNAKEEIRFASCRG